MIEIESLEQFEDECKGSNDLIIVDFYGVNCGPCKKIAPLLEEMEEMYRPLNFYKVCAQKALPVFGKYQITSVPTLLFMSKEPYGTDEMVVRARLTVSDITRENIMAMIGEYKQDITLK